VSRPVGYDCPMAWDLVHITEAVAGYLQQRAEADDEAGEGRL